MNKILSSLNYALSGKERPWSFRSVSVTANSLEQSPSWTAESSSACQEIPRSLWKPKVHCRNHKRPPPVPNSEPQQYVRLSPSHFLKTVFNNILPSTHRSSTWYIIMGFSHQNPLCTSPVPHTCHIPILSHPSYFDHVINIWCRFQSIILLVT